MLLSFTFCLEENLSKAKQVSTNEFKNTPNYTERNWMSPQLRRQKVIFIRLGWPKTQPI